MPDASDEEIREVLQRLNEIEAIVAAHACSQH
jgi:hypothetical protein